MAGRGNKKVNNGRIINHNFHVDRSVSVGLFFSLRQTAMIQTTQQSNRKQPEILFRLTFDLPPPRIGAKWRLTEWTCT